MNLVNRGFIFIKPKPSFVEWALQIDPDLLMDEHAEGSVYLIEEEFWDDELLLKNYAKKMANHEFSCITEDVNQWVNWTTIEEFEALFHIEIGCSCIDLRKEPLNKEALD
ncbi:MAG: hypothetical protein RL511_831 [Bacteroidota bacterium]|jgi:hypothetical protein